MASPTFRAIWTALLASMALACGDAQPPTGPLPPAEPTGTFLLYHPNGTLYTLHAGSDVPTEVSRLGQPVISIGASLAPGGASIVGMGLANGSLPRGIRKLDLRGAAQVSTLATLGEETWTFAERFSPDGQRLAFAASNLVPGRGTLMQLDLTTRAIEQLWINTGDDTEFSRFSWLPDRSALVGQLWGLNRFRMAKFDLGTRQMTILSDWMTADRMTPTMRLSRDGRTIAYNTQAGELRFITLNGQPAAGFPTDLRGILPAFSPDGRLLAYSKLITEPSSRLDGIWIYRFSDGATWRLFSGESGTNANQSLELLDWE